MARGKLQFRAASRRRSVQPLRRFLYLEPVAIGIKPRRVFNSTTETTTDLDGAPAGYRDKAERKSLKDLREALTR